MFQWIRRTSYATYFTLTGSYVDFSFWVLRRRHNIMPTRFLTWLRWSRMHHNLSIAFKRTYLSWIEKKTYVLWKLLTDTWYQQRWIIPICDGNKNKTSVVTDRLQTGGDHIVVTQRNWSKIFQQSNCCSVNPTLYNSVPIQKLNIKSKTLLIKKLQLTYEKENKPGRNRVSPSWRQSENDASFLYLKIAAFGRWANQIAALQSSSGLRGLILLWSIHNFNWTIYWTAGPIRFFEISTFLSLSKMEALYAIPFHVLEVPNLKLKKPGWVKAPSAMVVFAFVLLSYFLVTGGKYVSFFIALPRKTDQSELSLLRVQWETQISTTVAYF